MAKSGLSAARAPLVPEDDLHRWRLPGPCMQIEMHSSAIGRISHDLMRAKAAGDRPGGLLLGKIERLDPGTVKLTVTDVESADCKDLHTLLMNSGMVLGFYRIVGQDELALTDLDLNLIRSRFPDRDKIFLLVKPSVLQEAPARFCYWTDRGIDSEFSKFPQAIRLPQIVPALPAPAAPAVESKGQAISLPHSDDAGWRRLTKPAFFSLAFAIAAALIIAAVMWLRGSAVPDRLRLDATPVVGGLRLNWSKGATVASASAGLLIIRDGDQQQELPLNKQQLLEETVVYMPASENVSFTLEVTARGVVHRDSITVFTPRPNAQAPALSAGVPTLVPAVPAVPRPPVPNSANPPEPRVPAEVAISTPPPATAPAPVQPALTIPAPPKEQPAPDPKPVASSPEPTQNTAVQVAGLPSRPAPIVEPEPAPPAAPAPAISQVPAVAPPVLSAPAKLPTEGYVPPQPLRQARPVVPRNLKALISREIPIEVDLSIDETGKVIRAQPLSGAGVLQTSLGRLAADAARLWKFQPARRGDRNVPSEIRIQFQFGPGS